MAPQPMIVLTDLCKDYAMGDTVVHALRNVNCVIAKGDFIAVMGASGSGKSTLMNIIGCLDSPSSGTYLLDGEEIQMLSPDRPAAIRNRKMGFVFQAFNLLPRTTAVENVELPLLYNKAIPAGLARKKALEALARVGIGERALHFSNQLSGGQQQRVAIARAIINDPILLLADEPTGNLDSATSVEIMAVFQHLNRNGITVIMVTHEPDIAQYASRRLTFRDGRITSDEKVANRRSADQELSCRPPEPSGVLS
jgi:putative ABC transport system ATP-binding protein